MAGSHACGPHQGGSGTAVRGPPGEGGGQGRKEGHTPPRAARGGRADVEEGRRRTGGQACGPSSRRRRRPRDRPVRQGARRGAGARGAAGGAEAASISAASTGQGMRSAGTSVPGGCAARRGAGGAEAAPRDAPAGARPRGARMPGARPGAPGRAQGRGAWPRRLASTGPDIALPCRKAQSGSARARRPFPAPHLQAGGRPCGQSCAGRAERGAAKRREGRTGAAARGPALRGGPPLRFRAPLDLHGRGIRRRP